MRNYFIILCVTLLNFCFPNVFGQTQSKDSVKIPKSYWFAGGTGISSLGNLSITTDINTEISNRWLISLSGIGEISSLLDFSDTRETDVSTFSVSTGKIFKQKSSLITVSSGLGFVNVHTRDYSSPGIFNSKVTDKYQNTISVPILINGYLVGLQALGLGVGAYVNLNTVQTTAGFHAKFSFGRLSTRPVRNKPR